jgi:hypothetical protein
MRTSSYLGCIPILGHDDMRPYIEVEDVSGRRRVLGSTSSYLGCIPILGQRIFFAINVS